LKTPKDCRTSLLGDMAREYVGPKLVAENTLTQHWV